MFFKNHGLLGQNERNLKYIKGGNFKLARRLADSKLATKKYLARQGVAVPQTLQIIAKHSEIDAEKIESYEPPFVIKPNNGYGGKGILIIDQRSADGTFVTNTGEIFSSQQLAEHFTYVLDGFFSLSGGRDKVIIEKKIVITKEIELLGKYGLPDIRVIAYNMVPVMAMIRIPTQQSDGKANIHAGACAAGIDIGSGRITYISSKGKTIKTIPGIGDVRGIIIPHWDKILMLAVQVQKATGIKFLGCDIVLDEVSGPQLLEINIRPGLEVQNVNLAPLGTRLDKVEGVDINSVEKGVRIGRDLFSGDIEEKIQSLSGKKVAGQREYLKIIYDEKEFNYLADIRISHTESYIASSFLTDILKIDIGEKTGIKLGCELLGVPKNIFFKIADIGEDKLRLGRNALKGFLLDPFKYKKGENPILLDMQELKGKNVAISKTHESQLLELDKKIMKIDKKLLLLKYVKPINIAQERQKFIEHRGLYTPVFEYKDIPFDLDLLERELKTIEIPDIPLSEIYANKQEETHHKILFLRAFSQQNEADMTLYSKKIFGEIQEENFTIAKDLIAGRDDIRGEDEFLEYEDIKGYIKKFNHIYGVKIKITESDQTARFTMKGDVLMFRRGAKVGKREMRSIIAHEIEGHYLRKINGRKSAFSLLARGGAGYIETDEGIAIYNQNRFLTPQDKKYYSIYERYYFTGYALKHSYRRLVKHLAEFYDEDYERVFSYMLRLKRGFKDPSKQGVFMKDVVYVNGFLSVESYLNTGGSLENLYLGKLHLDDLELARQHDFFTLHKKDLVIPFSA